jgi:ATP-dependent DNA ligase I
VSREVGETPARLGKVAALAAALAEADPSEVPVVVAYLSGELPQRQIGVGWAALRSLPSAAPAPSLTIAEVDAAFTVIGAVAGKGSAAERKRLVTELFGAATADEQHFLVRLLSGELRQGALDGVMTDAVARAAGVPVAEVRRAVMLGGSLPRAAQAALRGGSAELAGFGLRVGQPLKPMLAASEPTISAALTRIGGEAAVEWKLDGIRVQAHVAGGHVTLYTRTLDDITARLPEVVAALARLPVTSAVFDGELIALRPDGRPLPFQDTAARAASDASPGAAAGQDRPAGEGAGREPGGVRLSVFLFDVLHLDGRDLIDAPGAERHAELARVAPAELLMPRLVTGDAERAAEFFSDAIAHGHEGVVVKALDAPYAAGRRGAAWIKVKPRHTLDLVVLAVEWGHGRRQGWLSNLHLGARDPDSGGWVMLGKTFKGLTDELLTWQTEKLLALEDHRDDWTVYVRPELVVEIAFDGVQRSPRYPGGVALRFARVIRYREDKAAAEADTIDAVRALALLLALLLVIARALAAAEGRGNVACRAAAAAGQLRQPRGRPAEAGEVAGTAEAGQARQAAALGRLAEHLRKLSHGLGRRGRRRLAGSRALARPVTAASACAPG